MNPHAEDLTGICPHIPPGDPSVKIDYSKYWDRVKFWKEVIEQNDNFLGTSPPAVFVGSSFYPKVNVGVLSPTVLERDASLLDDPQELVRAPIQFERHSGLQEPNGPFAIACERSLRWRR